MTGWFLSEEMLWKGISCGCPKLIIGSDKLLESES